MEDDDDDLYEPSPAPATNGAAIQPSTTLANVKAEEQEEGEEGEASADEDESDSVRNLDLKDCASAHVPVRISIS